MSSVSRIFNISPEAFAKEGITVTKISEYNPEYIYISLCQTIENVEFDNSNC